MILTKFVTEILYKLTYYCPVSVRNILWLTHQCKCASYFSYPVCLFDGTSTWRYLISCFCSLATYKASKSSYISLYNILRPTYIPFVIEPGFVESEIKGNHQIWCYGNLYDLTIKITNTLSFVQSPQCDKFKRKCDTFKRKSEIWI